MTEDNLRDARVTSIEVKKSRNMIRRKNHGIDFNFYQVASLSEMKLTKPSAIEVEKNVKLEKLPSKFKDALKGDHLQTYI